MNNIESDLNGIKHATALINPTSSNARRGQKRLERLVKASPFEISRVTTSKDPDITKALIREALEQSDLLLVVAGDGTFNSVVRTIIANNLSAEAKSTPLWSLGGGNAEDGTKTAHTRSARAHPEQVLKHGRIVSTYPICFEVTKKNLEQEIYPAAFYATLGVSALLSSGEFLNQESYRESMLGKLALTRHISELSIGLRGMMNASQNLVHTDQGPREFFDEGFINSHIMAKYLRFPTQLTKPELFHYQAPNRRTLISYIPSSVIDGNLGGDYLGPGESLSFFANHDLFAQFDGETELIPASSQVNIRIHDQPLRLVVTNPEL